MLEAEVARVLILTFLGLAEGRQSHQSRREGDLIEYPVKFGLVLTL